ncbi:MAG: hypothetical protein D4R67_11715 [Bacteroidetes bacterium]|nr:MAG: hypothetical protein D4R67_11715 [Bacteroidota bacterium]
MPVDQQGVPAQDPQSGVIRSMTHGDEPHPVHLPGIPMEVWHIGWYGNCPDALFFKCEAETQPDPVQEIVKHMGCMRINDRVSSPDGFRWHPFDEHDNRSAGVVDIPRVEAPGSAVEPFCRGDAALVGTEVGGDGFYFK